MFNKETVPTLKYQTYAFRITEETGKLLKAGKQQSGLSWNRYILTLVDEDYKSKQSI